MQESSLRFNKKKISGGRDTFSQGMEDYRSLCGRVGFLCFFLGIFLLIGHVKAENITNPRANVNLGPIQGWRSAYYCLMNISKQQCVDKDVLSDRGVVDVSLNEVEEYCKPEGCRDHTLAVLKCIYDVKPDFWFANKATVKVLNETITNGCSASEAFSTVHYSSAIKVYQKAYTSFISTLVFISIFNL